MTGKLHVPHNPPYYIPFDTAAWTSEKGVKCPRHGLIHGGLMIRIEPTPGNVTIEKYCGICVRDILSISCFVVEDKS